MKVKTNFKKMYLIDDDMYNTINSKMLDRDNIQNQHYENRFNPTIQLLSPNFNQVLGPQNKTK